MALLAATFHKVRQAEGTVRIHNLNMQLTGYLNRMDVFQGVELVGSTRAHGRRHDHSDAFVEVTGLEQQRDVERTAQRLAASLVGKMPVENRNQIPDEMTGYTELDRLEEPIQYALNELLENALTHARRAVGCVDARVWASSQYYPKSGLVRLGIVDNGCGFLATLRGHQSLTEETDLAAILAALQPRVSCNRDLKFNSDSVNQGVGLTTTRRIAESAGGYLLIASGNTIHSPKQSIHLPHAKWQGVAIALECKREKLPDVRYRELMPLLNMPPIQGLRFE
ncbi:MAG: ATP-binding protein [Gallionella sp.]